MKAVPLRPADTAPDGELVAVCEKLLETARSGRLRGIAYVSILMDSETGYAIAGPEMREGLLRAAGLLQWLAGRAIQKWDERSPEKSSS